MKSKPLRLTEPELTIRDLLSYRLHRVANQISRSAALRYRRQFGVSLGEWRTVALLGAEGPLSLNEVAKATGLEKSQMSRVVAGLVKRGLVLREIDREDARCIRLALTRSGRRLCEGLIEAAAERNDRLLGCLNEQERETLLTILHKLDQEARSLVDQERSLGSGRAGQVKAKRTRG